MQNWLNRGDLSFLNTPLPFSAEEQRWLQKHRRVRLLVNPYFPPFTPVDDEDELRGIMADMLNIFSLQTGLQFEPILVRNRHDLAKRMERGLGDHARRHPQFAAAGLRHPQRSAH